jgi:hypothetical protein
LKFDVNITGLKPTGSCGENAWFGIDVRGAVKSSLKYKGSKMQTETDASNARCPIDFSWATGVVVDGQVKPVNFTQCNECKQADTDEEGGKPESDEHNNCCRFTLDQGSSSSIFWDPTLTFSDAPRTAAFSLLSVFALFSFFLF